MIDEKKTFEMFGYTSDSFKPQSHKKVVAICNNCGKERILDFRRSNSLCLSCARSGKGNNQFGKTGKNSPNWNLNKTDEERQDKRKYPEYYAWRKAVFKRDNYTCQICGDNTSGNLNAHHLEGYTNNPDKRTILENGETLCKKCHKNFHRQYGYNNTKEQYIEFKKQYGK